MNRLHVLHDARCGLCRFARLWASEQPAFIELVFIPSGSDEARPRFPHLSESPQELLVISDDGRVYRDSAAWIMCLYALEDYREWSIRLANPLLRPFARQAFAFVSENRHGISSWLHLSDRDAADVLRRVDRPSCALADRAGAPHLLGH